MVGIVVNQLVGDNQPGCRSQRLTATGVPGVAWMSDHPLSNEVYNIVSFVSLVSLVSLCPLAYKKDQQAKQAAERLPGARCVLGGLDDNAEVE